MREPPLSVDPPGLIKPHSPVPHDLLNFPLCRCIQPTSRITGRDVSLQVKVVRSQAGFDIVRKRGWKATVDVVGYGYEMEPS